MKFSLFGIDFNLFAGWFWHVHGKIEGVHGPEAVAICEQWFNDHVGGTEYIASCIVATY